MISAWTVVGIGFVFLIIGGALGAIAKNSTGIMAGLYSLVSAAILALALLLLGFIFLLSFGLC